MSESLIGGGQFTGPTPTPLGQGISQALALQGGSLPGLAASPGVVVPVIVVGDTSENLARALVGPRAWAAQRTAIGAGNVFWLRVRAGPNPIVIELLRIVGSGAALAAQVGLNVSTGDVFAGVPALVALGPGISIGGQPLSANIGISVANTPALGFGSSFLAPGFFDNTNRRIFIPAGGSFGLATGDVAVSVAWEVVFREVPS